MVAKKNAKNTKNPGLEAAPLVSSQWVDETIYSHDKPRGTTPPRAWSREIKNRSGGTRLAIVQHADFPGEWFLRCRGTISIDDVRLGKTDEPLEDIQQRAIATVRHRLNVLLALLNGM